MDAHKTIVLHNQALGSRHHRGKKKAYQNNRYILLKQRNSWYNNLVSDENNSMQLEPHLTPKKNIKPLKIVKREQDCINLVPHCL